MKTPVPVSENYSSSLLMEFANKKLVKIQNENTDKKTTNSSNLHNTKYYVYSNKTRQKSKNWFVNCLSLNEKGISESEYSPIEKPLKVKWMNQFKSKISLDKVKSSSNSVTFAKNN